MDYSLERPVEVDTLASTTGGAPEPSTTGGLPPPCGDVYTWGSSPSGELGHDQFDPRHKCSPFPSRVPSLTKVVNVSCGDGFSAALTCNGVLFTWGKGIKCGHGTDGMWPTPQPVEFFRARNLRVVQVSCGEVHMGCVDEAGGAWCWGKGMSGALGSGSDANAATPVAVVGVAPADGPLRDALQMSCGFRSSAVVTRAGALLSWGSNAHGKLGQGREAAQLPSRSAPGRVLIDEPVAFVDVGCHHAGAITHSGTLYTWGYGGSGALGHGTRDSHATPRLVEALCSAGRVSHVSCTKGQQTPNLLKADKSNLAECIGIEAPHTLAVVGSRLYSWGSAHKGMLGNLRLKTLYSNVDELVPYAVGGMARDEPVPTGYLADVPVVQGAASSIHSAVVGANGSVYCFGCGSTGRMGVREYMEGLSGGRDSMKCYLSAPTAIQAFAENRIFIQQIATARRHMIAIGTGGPKRSTSVAPRAFSRSPPPGARPKKSRSPPSPPSPPSSPPPPSGNTSPGARTRSPVTNTRTTNKKS